MMFGDKGYGKTMLMHINTGSVASASEWRDSDGVELDHYSDYDLVEVERDARGDWVEVEA
jgi:hypothetical protein